MENINWEDLVFYIADEDFIEYLHEMGYDTIEEVELYEEWDNWVAENVEETDIRGCECACWCNSCLLGNCCRHNVTKLPSDSWGTYTTMTFAND